MADKVKPKPIYPNYDKTEFGIGTMHTRKGSGLMTDDTSVELSSAKPGPYGAHNREEPEAPTYQKGGAVGSPSDPLSASQRKLADRVNVNEVMQGKDDARYPGVGTVRDRMPASPESITYPEGNYSQGGRVKHGSDTCVVCKDKFS